MTACNRCGASAWHPEVRACTATNCELRGRTPAKAGVAATGAPLADTAVAPVPANDSIPVHARSNAR